MQALLVLYMAGHLLEPGVVEQVAGFAALRAGLEAVLGTLSTQALASQIFGLFIGHDHFWPPMICPRPPARLRCACSVAIRAKWR
jgi:POT family proton-dependent oligopeptide transporter